MTAVGKGLDAYVAVDASGTFSETKRQVGLLRMLQEGVILSDYATLMVEILRDLGGHLKTGHTWTLQNRPTERNQNKSIYTARGGVRANTFLRLA